jgi:hypothetical protein
MMKFLNKYWQVLTGLTIALVTIFGWLWHMKTRMDDYLAQQQSLLEWKKTAQEELDNHDNSLDEHSTDIHTLKDHEDLRLKGLLK